MAHVYAYTPTYADMLRPETAASIQAQHFDGHLEWVVGSDNPFPYPDLRNVLHLYRRGRALFLESGADAMLTVEHDMLLPSNAVQKLYDTGAPVVYAVYLFRHSTRTINAFRYDGPRNAGMTLMHYPTELRAYRRAGAGRVSGAGFGCTLIRREVLERIEFHGAAGHHGPDVPFAVDCLRAGITQVARFDVTPLHYCSDEDKWLHPYKDSQMSMVKVKALQTFNTFVQGESRHFEKGIEYEMPQEVAQEMQRAAFVAITAEVESHDYTDPDEYVSEVEGYYHPEPTDYASLTLAELRELARKRGLAGHSSMKKDELVAALEA